MKYKLTSSQRRLLNEAEIELDTPEPSKKPEEAEEVSLDIESPDLQGEGVKLLSTIQDFLESTASKLNKVGNVMGSEFDDHSTRTSLESLADQLRAITNGINEKIVKISAQGDVSAVDLLGKL
jgi:hypothetical protein